MRIGLFLAVVEIFVVVSLAGTMRHFVRDSPPDDWMQANLQSLGCQPLRRLCIPGSHDAGMSQFNAHTATDAQNTETQTLGVADQLAAGMRYFDIRPVISGGSYWTGHYSNTDTALGWQGADGQSIDSVVDDVNSFTASNQELVILYLSHTANTDTDYSSFSEDEWSDFLDGFSNKLDNKFEYDTTTDMTSLPLATFIQNFPAVVTIIGEDVDLEGLGYGGHGIFYNQQFPTTGSYADSDNLDVMRADQYSKLLSSRTSPDSDVFQLSWTQTLTASEDLDPFDSIIAHADVVYPHLFDSNGTPPSTGVLLWTTTNTYPNIILIDNVQTDRLLTSLAIEISKSYSSC